MDFNSIGDAKDSDSADVNSQIDSLIQDELNSNNFERSINMAFSNLSRMINLNNPDLGLLNLNSTSTSTLGASDHNHNHIHHHHHHQVNNCGSTDNSGISDADIGLPILVGEKNDIFPEFLTNSFLTDMEKESECPVVRGK